MIGKVVWVSADSLTDEKSGKGFYLARVEVARQNVRGGVRGGSKGAKGVSDLALYPGMPAEVMIVTGERSFLAYLAAPLLRSFNRAFREE